jgi:hypothetical protein
MAFVCPVCQILNVDHDDEGLKPALTGHERQDQLPEAD